MIHPKARFKALVLPSILVLVVALIRFYKGYLKPVPKPDSLQCTPSNYSPSNKLRR